RAAARVSAPGAAPPEPSPSSDSRPSLPPQSRELCIESIEMFDEIDDDGGAGEIHTQISTQAQHAAKPRGRRAAETIWRVGLRLHQARLHEALDAVCAEPAGGGEVAERQADLPAWRQTGDAHGVAGLSAGADASRRKVSYASRSSAPGRVGT